MKKKIIIAVAAVVVVIGIACAILIPKCSPPEFNVDGTYVAENGAKVVISGNKISSEDIKDLNGELKLDDFDIAYISMKEGGPKYYRWYDLSEDIAVVIDNKNGEISFGYSDEANNIELTFVLQK